MALAVAGWVTPGLAHKPKAEARLSKIGPAPEFTLTDQDGKRV